MHIHILETGAPPEPLDKTFGAYPAMFSRLFDAVDAQFSYSSSKIYNNETAPPVDAFDGLLITGSRAGVYEGHEWIAPAEALIRETARAGKPQIGICFGHQLMAQAFGGKVEKSANGWGVGIHDYELESAAPWMNPAPSRIACAASHQDQVIDIPEGARALAGSPFCPNAILAYRQGPAISFQPHPEFAPEFADALLRKIAGRIPKDRVEDGLRSLKGRSDRLLLARWMMNFFQAHQ